MWRHVTPQILVNVDSGDGLQALLRYDKKMNIHCSFLKKMNLYNKFQNLRLIRIGSRLS